MAPWLALLVTLGFLGALFVFFFGKKLDICDLDKGRDLLMMLLGALTSVMVQVIQYFFGSSAGSADKSQLLAKQGQSGK